MILAFHRIAAATLVAAAAASAAGIVRQTAAAATSAAGIVRETAAVVRQTAAAAASAVAVDIRCKIPDMSDHCRYSLSRQIRPPVQPAKSDQRAKAHPRAK